MKKSIVMQGRMHVQKKLRELRALGEQYKIQEQRLQGQLQRMSREVQELAEDRVELRAWLNEASDEILELEHQAHRSRCVNKQFQKEIKRLQRRNMEYELRLREAYERHRRAASSWAVLLSAVAGLVAVQWVAYALT